MFLLKRKGNMLQLKVDQKRNPDRNDRGLNTTIG